MVSTKNIFKSIIASVFLYLLMAPVYAASISATLDRQTVYEGESFQLILEVNGSADSQPDFKPIENDFEILSRNKSSSMQFANGKMSSKVQWILTLRPKRKGKLQIPAISFGKDTSNKLFVNVKPAQTSKAGAVAEDIFLQVEASPTQAYVQSQIIYTVRIYVGIRINNASLSEPELSHADAVIERLGEDKSFETMHLGRRYHVIERQYAIFPQQSGTLDVKPVLFSGQIVNNASRFMSPFAQLGRDKQIQSKQTTIKILPVPTGQQAKTWLPAGNVTLVEQWPDKPPKFKVGEAVTRTLVLTAEGLTAAQLPELASSTPDGFKLYPDQAKLADHKQSNGIIGQRTEKIAMIANRPGKHYLPEITVNWWNTKTNKAEITRIPRKMITVLAASKSDNPIAKSVPPMQSSETTTSINSKTQTSLLQESATINHWLWVSLMLTIGWLSTLTYMWYKKNNQREHNKQAPDSKNKILLSINQAEKKIKQACLADDANATKDAILNWAKLSFPENNLTSLTEIKEFVDEATGLQLDALNKQLYSQDADNWSGKLLWENMKSSNYKANKSNTQHTDKLVNLYPL